MYYATGLYSNNIDVVETLIECNVDVNQKDKLGDTVLMKLCNFEIIDYHQRKNGDYSIFDILI